MDWKEFFKPDLRKLILFLLPIIFMTILYLILWAIKSNGWVNESPVNFVIFHFPCFIESKLFCSENCCFSSIATQVGSSLIFYLPWFLFSWFIVWANDKVELRGYLWRKIHETKEPNIKTEIKESPVGDYELIKKEQSIKAEEERIKQEKDQIKRTIDDVNVKKLLEIGLDMNQKTIRCSNCTNWESINNKDLSAMIKKHGVDMLWKYKCKKCKKTNK